MFLCTVIADGYLDHKVLFFKRTTFMNKGHAFFGPKLYIFICQGGKLTVCGLLFEANLEISSSCIGLDFILKYSKQSTIKEE